MATKLQNDDPLIIYLKSLKVIEGWGWFNGTQFPNLFG